jgi:hypothetical protein
MHFSCPSYVLHAHTSHYHSFNCPNIWRRIQNMKLLLTQDNLYTLLYANNQMLMQDSHDKLATAFSLYFTQYWWSVQSDNFD